MNESSTTLLVGIITAVGAVIGYFYQKQKEREFELVTVRRDVYKRFVENLAQRILMMPQMGDNPDFFHGMSLEQYYAVIRNKYPETWKIILEGIEVNTLLCIYGTDRAVKKASEVQLQSAQFAQELSKPAPDLSKITPPDVPGLVLTLRQSVYGKSRELENTTVTREEIGQMMTM